MTGPDTVFRGAGFESAEEDVVAWFALQSVATLLLAFSVGVLVGWLVRGARAGDAAVRRAAAADDVAGSPVPAGAILAADVRAVEPVASGAPGEPDDGSTSSIVSDPDSAPGQPVTPESEEVVPVTPESVTPEPVTPEPVTPEIVPPRTPADEPAPAESGVDQDGADPRAGEVIDDLTLIDGINEDMAAALTFEGFGSFFALANASEDQLRRALRVNRIRSAPGIGLWAERAQQLADEAAGRRSSGDDATPDPAQETGSEDETEASGGPAQPDGPGRSQGPAPLTEPYLVTEPIDLSAIARTAEMQATLDDTQAPAGPASTDSAPTDSAPTDSAPTGASPPP